MKHRLRVSAAVLGAALLTGASCALVTAQAAESSTFVAVTAVAKPDAIAAASGDVAYIASGTGITQVTAVDGGTRTQPVTIPDVPGGITGPIQLKSAGGAVYALAPLTTSTPTDDPGLRNTHALFRISGTTATAVPLPQKTAVYGTNAMLAALAVDVDGTPWLAYTGTNGMAPGGPFGARLVDGSWRLTDPVLAGGVIVKDAAVGYQRLVATTSTTSQYTQQAIAWQGSTFLQQVSTGINHAGWYRIMEDFTFAAPNDTVQWGFDASAGGDANAYGRCLRFRSATPTECPATEWPIDQAVRTGTGAVVLASTNVHSYVTNALTTFPQSYALVPAPGAEPIAVDGPSEHTLIAAPTSGPIVWGVTDSGQVVRADVSTVPVPTPTPSPTTTTPTPSPTTKPRPTRTPRPPRPTTSAVVTG